MTALGAGYEIKSFTVDPERSNVTAYAVFTAAHTGPGGPVARPASPREPTMFT